MADDKVCNLLIALIQSKFLIESPQRMERPGLRPALAGSQILYEVLTTTASEPRLVTNCRYRVAERVSNHRASTARSASVIWDALLKGMVFCTTACW